MKDLCQPFPVGSGFLFGKYALGTVLRHLFIGIHTGSHIIFILHPAFDLQRVDAGIHKRRNILQRTKIFHGQQIFTVILLPAGLSASSAVTAPSPCKGGQITSAAVADAHGAVHKGLHLDVGKVPDVLKFPDGQLTGRDNSGKAQSLYIECPLRRTKIHLCAGMQRKLRKAFLQKLCNTQILYKHSIQPLPVERHDYLREFLQFLIFQ